MIIFTNEHQQKKNKETTVKTSPAIEVTKKEQETFIVSFERREVEKKPRFTNPDVDTPGCAVRNQGHSIQGNQ
jgi:hypothetical protein